jgi:hypothetical protein
MKYLGQTTAANPHAYSGSGIYWNCHLKKHGNNFKTEIIKECSSKEELKYWGFYYSILWNVVESEDWANLIEEKGTGGDNTSCWTEDSKIKNKIARDSWTSHTKGKTYNEIYGLEKSEQIKKKQSEKLKNKKLNLSDEERKRRKEFITKLNYSRIWTENQISKRSETFKKRNSNVGFKNGMNTNPESRLLIAEKNSKIHLLQNLNSGEEIYVKNITQWAKSQNLNPSTVLVKFCKNKPVNGWIRIKSMAESLISS